jgi:ABC-type transporter Mla subunit MlaD
MRRSVGGRNQVLYVRLTEVEDGQIRQLALRQGVSAQRLVIEAALSGSAEIAAARRRAAVEVQSARAILKGIANNLNQLTKWANTNHALPDQLERVTKDLAQAIAKVEKTVADLGSVFTSYDDRDEGGGAEMSS